jgi:signal transduction histidine kinase
MHSSFEDYRLAGVGLESAAEQVNAPPFILNHSNAAAVARTMQQLIDDLPEQIALLDEQCTILVTNRGWNEAVDQHGYRELSVGHNYRAFCAQKAAEGYEPAIEALAALEDIGRGTRAYWQLTYNGRDRWSGRDYQISIHRIVAGTESLISVARFDLTEIEELRREKAAFGPALIASQTVERQRIARELHDSTSQLLTAAGLLLCRLRQISRGLKSRTLVDELQALIDEANQEIRVVSYLAVPPALKTGLPDAVKAIVGGFGRRTGIQTSFEIVGDVVPTASAETVLYRIAQEALSNVYRHANATRLRVLLSYRRSAVHLIVSDDGVGIPVGVLLDRGRGGVGLASMRSRLSEVGGRLSIRRLSPGTALVASIGMLPPE